MLLGKLKEVYRWIDSWSSGVKTIVIIMLAFLMVELHFSSHTKAILEDYRQAAVTEKVLAEKYTEIITPQVNGHIEHILMEDKDASNVLLLNYHNTLQSTHGLSYRYLTALTEKRRINDNQFIRIDTIENYYRTFPNLVALLEESGAKSAAMYPIVGIDGPIGMIVVIYPVTKEYYLGYYNSVIAPCIQPLSTLLDYNSIRKKFKMNYESRQEEQGNMLQRFFPYVLE